MADRDRFPLNLLASDGPVVKEFRARCARLRIAYSITDSIRFAIAALGQLEDEDLLVLRDRVNGKEPA